LGKVRRVLIVDDYPIVGERLSPGLARFGYDVQVCESGREAVDLISQQHFDIVVTDIRMEGVDGLKVLEHATHTSPQTKVVIITGYATLELAREALAMGAYDFLAKPFKPKELRAVLARAASALAEEASQ